MDVLSQSEMRMREKMKRIRPLDHVIRRAVAEEEAEAAMAGAPAPAPAAAAAKVRFAGPSAEEEREARRHHRAAHKHRQRRHREKKPWERVHIMEEGTGDEARGASAGRSDATKTREDYAQEGERPVSFAASVGRSDGKPKNMKAYPHHLAPGVLRRQTGMASRTADLNAELAKAREAKFDADMRAMADAEAGCAEALRQSDGKRLRLARLGSPLTWQMCGFLALRGKMFGWHWTRAYYVLTNNILYVFPTNASSARVKIALPILGALVARSLRRRAPPVRVRALGQPVLYGARRALALRAVGAAPRPGTRGGSDRSVTRARASRRFSGGRATAVNTCTRSKA